MHAKSSIVAYAIAAIAIVGAAFLYFENRSLEDRVDEIHAVAVNGAQTAVTPTVSVEPSAEEEVRELTAELAEANAEIALLESRLTESTSDTALESSEDADTEDEAEAVESEDDDSHSLDELRERIRDNAGAAAQMKALTEMAYADFFGAVDLDPATKNALRETLVDSQLEQVTLARYAMQEGATGREYGAWKQDERERLNEQVRALLSPEKYEVWQEYENAYDERQLEATFENQLRAFSSGLTAENHEVVMTVALEEFLAEQWELENSEEPFTQNANIQLQLDAMEAMRERLQPTLEEDQYNELDNWLTMGENVMRQALENQEVEDTAVPN